MRVSECPGLTRVQERKSKIAVEGTYELCSEYVALPFLEIHRISRRLYRETVRDRSARILVVSRSLPPAYPPAARADKGPACPCLPPIP
jgi:hypothetical protein